MSASSSVGFLPNDTNGSSYWGAGAAMLGIAITANALSSSCCRQDDEAASTTTTTTHRAYISRPPLFSIHGDTSRKTYCESAFQQASAAITNRQQVATKAAASSPAAAADSKENDPSNTTTRHNKSSQQASHQKEENSEPFHVKQAYDIEDVLGEGGYGKVFLARRTSDGQLVALKSMPRQYTNDTGFQREVKALQLLSRPPVGPHPHICQLFDIHADDKHYYLAMELIEGGELFERLIQDGPYSEAQAASFLRQFAEALCLVHKAGLTHGDLKPENLLLSCEDYKKAQLKVVDFGCAVNNENAEQIKDFVGTPFYWPPELFKEGATLTPAIDLWAAGVIVYILLTGTHPFDPHGNASDEEVEQALQEIGREQQEENTQELLNYLVFDERLQGLSDSCLDLMRRLMHPDPAQRMTSDEFRRHPWVQGLTASWEKMEESHSKLKTFWRNRFRAEIVKKFAATIVGLSEGTGDSLSEEHLAKMFHALDLKKNGVLELEEMQQTFRSLGVSDEDITDIFQSADLDGSGFIQFDEFQSLMRNGKLETFWQNRFRRQIIEKFATTIGISGKDVLSEEDLERIFNALDLKKNKVLELEEVETTLKGLGVPDKEIQEIFASADLDGSGVIHFDEFRALMKRNAHDGLGLQAKYRREKFRSGILRKFGTVVRMQHPVSHEGKLREMFDAIDLDGNGVLDANELRVLLRSVGETEDLITRIVASVDLDRDGGLTWEEFVETMRTTEEEGHAK